MDRVVSGLRATGALHVGHLFGAINNFISLSERYDAFFFVATWHGLTTEYQKPFPARTFGREIIADLLASGLDPNKCTIFLQDDVLEHAELHLLFSMITPLGWLERVPTYKEQQEQLKEKELNTYGFLGYPILQAADIAIYRAKRVPVGQDQLPHLELTREIVRRFNHLYGKTLAEPEALLTEHPKVLGLDARKMSKSYGNAISLGEAPESVSKRVMVAVTDPQRVRRNDPGNPEVCPIFGLHKLFSDAQTVKETDTACRTAAIGCVDCKKRLLGNMLPPLAVIAEKKAALLAKPAALDEIARAGADKARAVAQKTMRDVRDAMQLSK